MFGWKDALTACAQAFLLAAGLTLFFLGVGQVLERLFQ